MEVTEGDKGRRKLVDGYSKSPELLEYKLYQIFDSLSNEAQVAVHNDIHYDIGIMVGEGKKKLVEEVAQAILNVSKAELMKEKQ